MFLDLCNKGFVFTTGYASPPKTHKGNAWNMLEQGVFLTGRCLTVEVVVSVIVVILLILLIPMFQEHLLCCRKSSVSILKSS